MNPWKIIGWIVLGLLLLVVYACAKVAMNIGEGGPQAGTTDAENATPPSYVLSVVSTECQDNYGRNRADITVKNVGGVLVPYAKAYVEFRDDANGGGSVLSAQDSYFNPHDIPPGATASATVYSSGGGAKSCGLTGVQDGDGNRVTLQ